ncbi:MAG: CHAT domain-containing protein [Blastocatellia bacterium]|nr:CHAT domain-containing protein [Blastocatellia bacterium]
MRVFISHSSKDKPAVEALAAALRERGIEPWLDKWEISAGDDIVASINAGLDEAGAGIIIFSQHSRESRWVEAEVSYLTFSRVEEGKILIPVIAGEGAWVPPLLRPLARRGIAEVEAIADALFGRKGGPPPRRAPEIGQAHRAQITLTPAGGSGARVAVRLGNELHSAASHESIPEPLLRAQREFLQGVRAGLRREHAEAERGALEANLAELGRRLRDFCLPGEAGEALAGLLDGCPVGNLVEIVIEAEGGALLGLPFEALRLPDDRLVATHRAAVMLRRPTGLQASAGEPLAGPLKILVAVGAPDEGQTASALLDQERELQNILDAIEPARAYENAEIRILEVGHPAVIASAIEVDAYHALHISCHGSPGRLELEDEEGRAVPVPADELIAPLKRKGRPLPLVLLNACHGGVQDGAAASLAEALLRAGVPTVLAMQTAVSDFYATALARAFYHHLARREHLLASRALAEARKSLEDERLKAVQRGAGLIETQPEYATAALFVAGEERPLANFALDSVPLRVRPVYEVAGPVPQLRIDDLIGRRRELRECLRALRDNARRHAGVVLTGIGGVGKSALAGRAMQRLREDGWLLAAHAGRFDFAAVAVAIGAALLESLRPEARQLGETLARPDLDERLRLQLFSRALAEERLCLVLDDFEQNLAPGGGAYLDPTTALLLQHLAASARRGRLLITCRHPVPEGDAFLRRIAIGPLSPAESRKLLLRLPALQGLEPKDLARLLRLIGGHPRMLEFLDALLRDGQGRLLHVTQKLQQLLVDRQIDPRTKIDDLDDALQAALLLGARDVFLEELLALARAAGIAEALLQTAVSSLPVPTAGLARMLEIDQLTAARALDRLHDLSLLHLADNAAWVHRWTAEGLARLDPAELSARHLRAGEYRWWRAQNETHSIEDAIESLRNFLAGGAFDLAAKVAEACLDLLTRTQQTFAVAALASEVLESLPETLPSFSIIADAEGQAHLALGMTERAVKRYQTLLARHERLASAEPDRADVQRNLSVLYNKMGDLYLALGQGDLARDAFLKSLAIIERLASAEPDRADFQRDLSVSFERMGDLYRALGQGDLARDAFLKSLAIRERLASAEPDRADFQRDLIVSLVRVGMAEPLGGGSLERALAIALAMQNRGALAPPDEGMIDALRRLIEERGKVA